MFLLSLNKILVKIIFNLCVFLFQEKSPYTYNYIYKCNNSFGLFCKCSFNSKTTSNSNFSVNNVIDFFEVIKNRTFFKLPLSEQFYILISFFLIIILVINFSFSSYYSYCSYELKKEKFLLFSELHDFIPNRYLIYNTELAYSLINLEKLFLIFIWKVVCGILIIVPILLIIAYSTLLE